MLRQIEWRVHDVPITKNTVLPVATVFCWKFCFSIRTCYKELIWSTNYPNDHIYIFFKSAGVFFQVAFSLWVSLKLILPQPLKTISIRMCHALWEQCCSCMYAKTARNKSAIFKKTTWVVKLLRCWSACKCNDMQTWFSVLSWHLALRFWYISWVIFFR